MSARARHLPWFGARRWPGYEETLAEAEAESRARHERDGWQGFRLGRVRVMGMQCARCGNEVHMLINRLCGICSPMAATFAAAFHRTN